MFFGLCGGVLCAFLFVCFCCGFVFCLLVFCFNFSICLQSRTVLFWVWFVLPLLAGFFGVFVVTADNSF